MNFGKIKNKLIKIIQEDDDDEIVDVFDQCLSSFIQRTTISRDISRVNLDFDITDSYFYRRLYQLLQDANEWDEVILRINNGGGFLETFIEICYYLLNTEAETIAEIHTAYSSAALIALACDKVIINPFSSMMLHACSACANGNIDEVKTNNENELKRFRIILDELCTGFLSKEEIDMIMNGKTFYFGAKEIEDRLKNKVVSKLRVRKEEDEDEYT